MYHIIETQETISEWATATFGAVASLPRSLARANEEMAELCKKAVTNADHDELAEEAADVVIVLCRAADISRADINPMFRIMEPTGALPIVAIMQANSLLAYCMEQVSDGKARCASIYIELIVRKLAEICFTLGTPLHEAVERKMATNRARVWALDGSGCGYHVEPGAA